jgi:ribonuclease J
VTAGTPAPAEVLLLEDGDLLRFDGERATRGERAPAGRVLIDGTRFGEVADEVLRDRRHLSAEGVLVPVVAISRQTGTIEGTPEIITRGFVLDPAGDGLIAEATRIVSDLVAAASVEERTDQGLIGERIRVEVRRFFRKRIGRRPLVLPVIMEI